MFLHVVIVVERFSSSALHEAVVEGFFEFFPCWMFSSCLGMLPAVVEAFLEWWMVSLGSTPLHTVLKGFFELFSCWKVSLGHI